MTERATPEASRARPKDAQLRRRVVDLSVLAVSAVVLGAATLIVADVDAGRSPLVPPPAIASAAPPSVASASTVRAPAPGLAPAPKPARRVVVVRRSRPS